jgi:DNA helicase-2/ATP-dependent DNA helicase PcrA
VNNNKKNMSENIHHEMPRGVDLESLNSEQRKAVQHINGPLLIIAGAGSGKTRVLTERVAYLMEKGIEPYYILALTFTNKAAKEMRDRIAKIVSRELANKLWAGTFHSIFAKLLRRNAEKIGFTSSFSIYDTEDTQKLIKGIMTLKEISYKKFPIPAVRSSISNAKNQLMGWREFSAKADNSFDKNVALIFKDYEENLISNNAMDFDDLLINMITLLRTSKETLEYYQRKFKYILVDEYQDTNRAQYIAIQMLSKAHQNICVVGDDAQSIYRWRGADIQNILDFQKDYPYSKTIRLEQNYRSTKSILAAADSVIKNNKNQLKKQLWTDNPDGELIEILETPEDRDEAQQIVKIIKKHIAGEYDLSDVAVLYRTNAQSLLLENAMRRSNIPYVIVGGMSFYQRKEIKDVLAYLRLIINPKDGESLLRIVNEPPRGLGRTSIGHIINFANENRITLFEAFFNAHKIGSLQRRAVKAAHDFIYLIKENIEKYDNNNTPETLMQFIEDTGLTDMYKEINTEDSLDRWNNIQQLISDISIYYRNNPEPTLDDYLQQVTLITDFDQKDTSSNKVTLMTLHSAKGMEYPVVFITGMEKGLFPLSRTEKNKEEEEEERRLFYVGITRAMEKLYLLYAKKRTRFGELSYQQPSDLLYEIRDELVEWEGNAVRRANKSINKSNTQFDDIRMHSDENYSQIPPESETLMPGDRVKHSQFGVGRIASLSGAGKFQKAVVMFESVGRKQLMIYFAKLQKL